MDYHHKLYHESLVREGNLASPVNNDSFTVCGDQVLIFQHFQNTADQERSAWVRAKTACEVAEISYKKFRQLIQVNLCEYGSVTKTIQESGLFAACREPFASSSVR